MLFIAFFKFLNLTIFYVFIAMNSLFFRLNTKVFNSNKMSL